MPNNLDTEKCIRNCGRKTLRYALTNFCPSLDKLQTHKEISAAFETWERVCGMGVRKGRKTSIFPYWKLRLRTKSF